MTALPRKPRLPTARLALVTLLGAVLLAGLAYLGVGYVVYDNLSRVRAGGGSSAVNTPADFGFRTGARATWDTTPYFMPSYETVHVPSRQAGLTLAAWYVAGSPDMPAVVLTHGIHSCKCHPEVLIPAGMLHRHGYNVLLIDLRNHGASDSDGGRTAVGNDEYLDVLGAWDWLQTEKGFAPEKIGLLGNSLGGGTTLIAFAEEPRVPAAFIDSPYANLPQIISEELERSNYPTWLMPGGIVMAQVVSGDNLVAHSPEDAIRRNAGRPLFIVHGTADGRINVRHTQQLQALAATNNANLTVWLPAGIDHVNAAYDLTADYESRLLAFFDAALGVSR